MPHLLSWFLSCRGKSCDIDVSTVLGSHDPLMSALCPVVVLRDGFCCKKQLLRQKLLATLNCGCKDKIYSVVRNYSGLAKEL